MIREQALRVEAALAGGTAFRPARPAEIVWMIQHALHRGLAEPLLAEAETSDLYGGHLRDGVLHSPSYADFGQVRLQEGGIDPDPHDVDDLKSTGRITRSGRKAWWRLNTGSPLGRRWLQVESEAGVGYQAQLALAECPPAVSQDAADLFAQLETLDFPVDYAVDLTLVTAEKARDQVRLPPANPPACSSPASNTPAGTRSPNRRAEAARRRSTITASIRVRQTHGGQLPSATTTPTEQQHGQRR